MSETTDLNRRNTHTAGGMLMPDYRASDLRRVDWSAFAAAGFRLIAVDLDNTLAVHGSEEPDLYARDSVNAMQAAGFTVLLYSNAAVGRDVRFASALGIDAIPDTAKPNPAALEAALTTHGMRPDEALVVGDQLITDVWSANRLGVASLWVEKRSAKELVTIRLKRLAEAVIVRLNRNHFARLPAAPPVSVYRPQQIP